MSTALYIFRLVWPFLKELVLGGATLKEGMKSQKKRVFLLFFISVLILSVFLIVPKFYQLSQEHIKLQNSVDVANLRRIEGENQSLKDKLLNYESGKPPPKTEPDSKQPAPNDVRESPPPHKEVNTRQNTGQSRGNSREMSARKKAYMDFFDSNDDD